MHLIITYMILLKTVCMFPVVAHQDATYLHTEPVPAIGFWIALEDATLQNGCLWMARGSHKSGVHRRLIRNPDKESKQALIYDKGAPFYPQSSFTPVPVSKGKIKNLKKHINHVKYNLLLLKVG